LSDRAARVEQALADMPRYVAGLENRSWGPELNHGRQRRELIGPAGCGDKSVFRRPRRSQCRSL